MNTTMMAEMSSARDPDSVGEKGKGKGKARDAEPSRLVALPPELIDRILQYLNPVDLTRVSETCRALYVRAIADYLWQPHVQDNVPGQSVHSSYPYASFRELYRAHDPRWFLPKYKIWFSDAGLPGRLIVARYDQRRGCIEAYQLVANNRDDTAVPWQADPNVLIFAFDPEVKLHLDMPIIRLPADPHNDPYVAEAEDTVITFRLRGREGSYPNTHGAAPDATSSSSSSSTTTSQPQPQTEPSSQPANSFQPEIPMRVSTIGHLQNSFIHARRLPDTEASARLASNSSFPYRHVWPPPTIPTEDRVLGAGLQPSACLRPTDAARSRREVCDRAFRIRKWIEMRVLHNGYIQFGSPDGAGAGAGAGGGNHHPPAPAPAPPLPPVRREEIWAPLLAPGPVHIGEEVSTYATLHPALYTPTPRRPFRGIWVGHYGGHGCEFLWIHQPDDDDDDDDDNDDDDNGDNGHDGDANGAEDGARPPEDEAEEEEGEGEDEPDANQNAPRRSRRRHRRRRRRSSSSSHDDADVYRGRLLAIKLTGDANVPRGECSWVADDLGRGGLVRVATEEPFAGVRVVRSRGHVAHTGFRSDTYVDSQLLLISHDRLAQYWTSMGHISYYHRVDIDRFLVPK